MKEFLRKILFRNVLLEILVTGILFSGINTSAHWVDSSHTIFLSQKLEKQVGDHQLFPVFWWNFLVREIDSDKDWSEAEKLCDRLKASPYVIRVNCEENISDYAKVIRDWAHDFNLRMPLPSNSIFQGKLDLILTQATLPTGESSFLELLRLDPFQTWQDLKSRAEAKLKIKLQRQRGFFFDPESRRVVIPIQMAFAPPETAKTGEFTKLLPPRWFFVGPHNSHQQNEAQIIKDVNQVSKLGALLLLLLSGSLIALKRKRVVLLIPPVLMAMAISTLATVCVFGKIHGLTVAFGTAIVGLALDYGLQAAFNGRSPYLWRSNFFGLVTTLIGLVILMTSTMPLLQQMMFFSIVGLVAAFGFFYVLFDRWPHFFIVEPFKIKPKSQIIKTAISLGLILSSFIFVFVLKPTVDMTRFDFQLPENQKISRWLFETLRLRAPLFSVSDKDTVMAKASLEKIWADSHGISIENIASYVPTLEAQSLHATTWRTSQCDLFTKNLDRTKKIFFKPFLDSGICHPIIFNFSSDSQVSRSYLEHLKSGHRWLSLWIPNDDAQEKSIRAEFPDVISLKEVVTEIPATLSRELRWMAPLSIFFAGLLLFIYYRKWSNVLLALLPFFTGVGLVSVSTFVFGLDVSFVTIIALVMVFGFSIDYGIFATDIHRGLKGQSTEGVWTGLSLAIFTTCTGFVPLLFCKHPILLGLGQTLFAGAVGTYIGTAWAIPGFSNFKKKFEGQR